MLREKCLVCFKGHARKCRKEMLIMLSWAALFLHKWDSLGGFCPNCLGMGARGGRAGSLGSCSLFCFVLVLKNDSTWKEVKLMLHSSRTKGKPFLGHPACLGLLRGRLGADTVSPLYLWVLHPPIQSSADWKCWKATALYRTCTDFFFS